MKAVFNDLQDHASLLNGTVVETRAELLAVLDGALCRAPFGCELEGENGYKLTLGIGRDIGFVQHGNSDGDVPCLMAVAPKNCLPREMARFLVGGTPSEIPREYCLPIDMVKEIAAYFLETGERSANYSWEEI